MGQSNTISEILNWFSIVNAEPDDKSKNTQFGVHLEEVSEMLDSMATAGIKDDGEANDMREAGIVEAFFEVSALADNIKLGNTPLNLTAIDRVELLDSLCDQIVTALGVAYMMGLDIEGGLAEVNSSNWSKFDDQGKPIFDENKKVMKGKNYRKAELDRFI
jgi:predicted HAD superfamily Cof-like phosphohydrolase